MTSKLSPFPKLRVTCLVCTFALPQYAHTSDDIDGDEYESAHEADLDDSFRFAAIGRLAIDDVLTFLGLEVTLPLDDLTREDDTFEINDREVVIFKFFSCVNGNYVVLGSDQGSEVGDGVSHAPSLPQTSLLTPPAFQPQRAE